MNSSGIEIKSQPLIEETTGIIKPKQQINQPRQNKNTSILFIRMVSINHKSISIDARALAAEVIGTFLLIFIGCGVVISTHALITPSYQGASPLNNDFLLAVSMAFGLAVTVIAYGMAHISGAHLNPAVSFGTWLVGDLSSLSLVLYTLCQFLGAMLGAAFLWETANSAQLSYATGEAVTGNNDTSYPPFFLGSNSVNPNVPGLSAFLGEAAGTFILVFTVLMTAVGKKSIAKNMAPMAIGFSLLLVNLVLIPTTSCGVNPARTFGPHVVSLMGGVPVGTPQVFNDAYVFYTAPFVGAAIAAFIAKFLFDVGNDKEEIDSRLKNNGVCDAKTAINEDDDVEAFDL